jgi:hypothetical protein
MTWYFYTVMASVPGGIRFYWQWHNEGRTGKGGFSTCQECLEDAAANGMPASAVPEMTTEKAMKALLLGVPGVKP